MGCTVGVACLGLYLADPDVAPGVTGDLLVPAAWWGGGQTLAEHFTIVAPAPRSLLEPDYHFYCQEPPLG